MLGLYDYNARWYDPGTGRFVSADTIVPDEGDPQAYARYSYVLNAPLIHLDPSGHSPSQNSCAQSIEQAILDGTVMFRSRYKVEEQNGSISYFWEANPSSLGTAIEDDTVLSHNHFGESYSNRYPGAIITHDQIEVLSSNGSSLGIYTIGSDVIKTTSGETSIFRFTQALTGVTPVDRANSTNTIAPGDSVAVAVMDGSGNNTRVKVVWAEVLTVTATTMEYDYPVNRGDSGGGVFLCGRLVGNNWYRKTTLTERPRWRIFGFAFGGTVTTEKTTGVAARI